MYPPPTDIRTLHKTTVHKKTTTTKKKPSSSSLSKKIPKNIIEKLPTELQDDKSTLDVIRKGLTKHDAEYISEKIDVTNEANSRGKVEVYPGWLFKAIKGDWTAPKLVKPKTEEKPESNPLAEIAMKAMRGEHY